MSGGETHDKVEFILLVITKLLVSMSLYSNKLIVHICLSRPPTLSLSRSPSSIKAVDGCYTYNVCVSLSHTLSLTFSVYTV